MSDRNVNRGNKRKRVVEVEVEDEVDLCSSSSLNYTKNLKTSKHSESEVENNDNEQFDFLEEALKKLHQLESEIAAIEEGTEDEDDDRVESIDYETFEENALAFEAEAIGFAVCARETLNYLASQGLTQDSPLVKSLRDRLVGKCKEFRECKI